jgi:hypothetical protein
MFFAVNLFLKCNKNIKTMARPIKETPVLRGKDAERFFDRMENAKPVSAEEIARIKKSASKFVFVLD